MLTEPRISSFPPGSQPSATIEADGNPNRVRHTWRPFGPGHLRVVVYARRLGPRRVLAFAKDFDSIFAEATSARRALEELRVVAREVARLYLERGAKIPVTDVPREVGDELIGSFVVDA